MRFVLLILAACVLLATFSAAGSDFRFPMPEFESGYQQPAMNLPPRAVIPPAVDIALLTLALALAAYAVIRRRSRRMVFVLALASLLYFGFYRKGCVCPVGSLQNVLLAVADHAYTIPFVVAVFFFLPLLFALYFGRVFCASVCPLGAIQEMCAVYPRQVPTAVDHVFTLIPYAYLGVAVLGIFTGSGFLICRYDPFVGFFRQGATLNMLLFGGGLLLLGVFVGRPYCRYLCPYGVLLRWTSTFSKWPATVTPAECTQCRLCETACPYSAIDLPVAPETAESRRKGVRRMIATLIAAPFLVAAMGAVGYLCHAPLARLNPTVQLAERIAAEEKGTFTERTIDSDAFRAGQNSPEELYATAHAIQVRFQYGAAALGVFLGLVICGRMLRLARAKENPDYVANRGACLSCARCFAYCPVETNNG